MGHWFEMDIVRTKKLEELVKGWELTEESSSVLHHRPRRGGVANDDLLWPNARVPYAFHGFIGEYHESIPFPLKFYATDFCKARKQRDFDAG